MLLLKDQEILIKHSPDVLVKWWCLLNNWQWPKELLPSEKPDLNRVPSESRRTQIMDYITNKVGNKLCLLEWNKEKTSPTEEFWGSRSSDIQAQSFLCPRCCAWKRVKLNDVITNYKQISWDWCNYHSQVEIRERESRERNQLRKRH